MLVFLFGSSQFYGELIRGAALRPATSTAAVWSGCTASPASCPRVTGVTLDHRLRPKCILDEDILNHFAKDYLYLQAIQFIKSVRSRFGVFSRRATLDVNDTRTSLFRVVLYSPRGRQVKHGGSFSNYAPMLYDISQLPRWSKVNAGMLKMFMGEVLHKRPVAQHFLFGTILPYTWTPSRKPERPQVDPTNLDERCEPCAVRCCFVKWLCRAVLVSTCSWVRHAPQCTRPHIKGVALLVWRSMGHADSCCMAPWATGPGPAPPVTRGAPTGMAPWAKPGHATTAAPPPTGVAPWAKKPGQATTAAPPTGVAPWARPGHATTAAPPPTGVAPWARPGPVAAPGIKQQGSSGAPTGVAPWARQSGAAAASAAPPTGVAPWARRGVGAVPPPSVPPTQSVSASGHAVPPAGAAGTTATGAVAVALDAAASHGAAASASDGTQAGKSSET